ncbi:hypothetical protein VTG60DRAFT_2717 [Thermothelomyces hinnuleus]
MGDSEDYNEYMECAFECLSAANNAQHQTWTKFLGKHINRRTIAVIRPAIEEILNHHSKFSEFWTRKITREARSLPSDAPPAPDAERIIHKLLQFIFDAFQNGHDPGPSLRPSVRNNAPHGIDLTNEPGGVDASQNHDREHPPDRDNDGGTSGISQALNHYQHTFRSSRHRRTRRNRNLYDNPTLGLENNRDAAGVRKIKKFEVEGLDFIFPYRPLGPGFFVVRCDSQRTERHFEKDPLRLYGNRTQLVRHFSARNARCHTWDRGSRPPTVEEIIRNWGYRGKLCPFLGSWSLGGHGETLTPGRPLKSVVENNGKDDVNSEWVAENNESLGHNGKLMGKKTADGGHRRVPERPQFEPVSSRVGPRKVSVHGWSPSPDIEVEVAGPSRSEGTGAMPLSTGEHANPTQQELDHGQLPTVFMFSLCFSCPYLSPFMFLLLQALLLPVYSPLPIVPVPVTSLVSSRIDRHPSSTLAMPR